MRVRRACDKWPFPNKVRDREVDQETNHTISHTPIRLIQYNIIGLWASKVGTRFRWQWRVPTFRTVYWI